MSTFKFSTTKSATAAILAIALSALSLTFSARADDGKNALIRFQLDITRDACPDGPTQRDCVFAYRKADTDSWDAAHPAKDEDEKTFRACTTPRALELETQYILDILQLDEKDWATRAETFSSDVQQNWKHCGMKE